MHTFSHIIISYALVSLHYRSCIKVRSQVAERLLTVGLPQETARELAQVTSHMLSGDSRRQSKQENSVLVCGNEKLGADENRDNRENHEILQNTLEKQDIKGRTFSQGSFITGSLVQVGALSSLLGQEAPPSPPPPYARSSLRSEMKGKNIMEGHEIEAQTHFSAAGFSSRRNITSACMRDGALIKHMGPIGPHTGSASPPGTSIVSLQSKRNSAADIIRTMRKTAVAQIDAITAGREPPPFATLDELMRGPDRGAIRIGEHVPRPTTVVAASIPELLIIQQNQNENNCALSAGELCSVPYQGNCTLSSSSGGVGNASLSKPSGKSVDDLMNSSQGLHLEGLENMQLKEAAQIIQETITRKEPLAVSSLEGTCRILSIVSHVVFCVYYQYTVYKLCPIVILVQAKSQSCFILISFTSQIVSMPHTHLFTR
jgi:hypothetical protein